MTSVATILEDIRRRGERGSTSEEASFRISVNINSYTGRRSELHRRGALERLAEKRDGQHVYVLPEFVGGRELYPYVPHRGPAGPEVESAYEQLCDWLSIDDGSRPDLYALRTILNYVKEDL